MSSVFDPHSPFARSIYGLSIGVLIVTAVILALVSGLVLFACWRFRANRDGSDPLPKFGNVKLEISYTLAPLVVLGVILVFTVRTMQSADPPANRSDDITIVAHQWWWEVRYPKSGVVTANEIHIPVGVSLLFGVESADVIHDFWVPELARKIDVIPGTHNHIWLSADHPGTYLGACAEFCGLEHAWMRIRVIAQTPQDFSEWEQAQRRIPTSTLSGEAAAGGQYFLKMTCTNCHAIAGTAASARTGPELTHLASRETLAAGRLTNTPDNLSSWLHNPEAYKPASHMPNLHLTDEQRRDLVAYLETLQ